MERRCPVCGALVESRQATCHGCGYELSARDSSGNEAEATGQPAVIELSHPGDERDDTDARRETLPVRGERKEVTVLFADVRGSTGMIEDADPEQVVERLDPAVQLMADSVHRYDGTVNRIQGDGIMALFGAPVAHEDHAARACLAGLAIQRGVARLRPGDIEVRVGLNSGEVVVRSVNNDMSINYEAAGLTVHLAHRMEQLAEPGRVYVTSTTAKLAEGFVGSRALGPIAIKGLKQPVEVFELVEDASTRTRWEVLAARGLTRFVGRTAELNRLREELENVVCGHGRMIEIVGEPGVGKSRLVHEFLQLLEPARYRVWKSGSVLFGQSIPYFPIVRMLESWLELGTERDAATVRHGVEQALASRSGKLADLEPMISALLGVPVEDESWTRLEPPQRRRLIIDGVTRLIRALGEEMPLVLVIEDMHWIDQETQNLLQHLVDRIETSQILMFGTYRPEYRVVWSGHGRVTRIFLQPLHARYARNLLDDLLGDDPELQSLKERAVERTQGTPLFLEEIVRTLVQSNALAGERGAYRLVRPDSSFELPSTVRALLSARIDRLPSELKELLQIAAVIGREIPVHLLEAIAKLPREQLLQRLFQLEELVFLYADPMVEELQFSFTHVLTRDVAYEGLLKDRRRKLHAVLVDAIETRFKDRLAEYLEVLGLHALSGELWHKAAAYLVKAGDKSMDRSAYAEAVTLYERALVALSHLPANDENAERGIDIRLNLRNALYPLGEHGRVTRYLGEAETLAMALGDRSRLAAVSFDKAHRLVCEGDLEGAIREGERALGIAADEDDDMLMIGAKFFLSEAYEFRGDFPKVIDLLLPDVERCAKDIRHRTIGTPRATAVDWLGTLGTSYAALGDFERALACVREAMSIAGEVTRPYEIGFACYYYGSVLVAKGEIEEALPRLEHGLAVYGDDVSSFPWLARELGVAYLGSRRMKEAVGLLEAAVNQARTLGLVFVQSWSGINHAEALAGIGAWERARASLDEARDLAERHGFYALGVLGSRVAGSILLRQPEADPRQATAALNEALETAERLQLRVEAATIIRLMAESYRLRGMTEESRETLDHWQELCRLLDIASGRMPESAGLR